MTHRHDLARDRAIAARWCALAEQRLEHLTEMFETGRWRRYHSEIAFLENIREAKRAVQTWRALATGEDVPAAPATGPFSLGWSPAPPAPRALSREARTVQTKSEPPKPVLAKAEQPRSVQPKSVNIAPKTTAPVKLAAEILAEITAAAPTVPFDEPPPVEDRVSEFTLDLDGIEARYPILRNAF